MDLLLRRRMMFAQRKRTSTDLYYYKVVFQSCGSTPSESFVPLVVETLELDSFWGESHAATQLTNLPFLLADWKTKEEAEAIAKPYTDLGATIAIERMPDVVSELWYTKCFSRISETTVSDETLELSTGRNAGRKIIIRY